MQRFLLIALAAGACGSEADDRPATLDYITTTILAPTCAVAECHSAFKQEVGDQFDLPAAARRSIVANGLVVFPDDADEPADAYLIRSLRVGVPSILDPGSGNVRMPYDAAMPEADIQLIEKWIALGVHGAQCVPTEDQRGCAAAARPGGGTIYRVVRCVDGDVGDVIETCDDGQICSFDTGNGTCVTPVRIAIFVLVLVGGAARAVAYPQYQMSRDQTCTACHLSPAGGGLLSENGEVVAETFSQWGTSPAFMYGKIPLPSWLAIGGDFRGAGGFDHTPDNAAVIFPMQAELYLRGAYDGFSLQLTAGGRPAQWVPGNGTPATLDRFWSREHYVMWQQGDGAGLYVRAGRFMPVFGLRFAEHPDYTRRFGGTPLYAETYGLAVEYVEPSWEAHLTGFIEDPLIDPVVHDNGAAGYAEVRLSHQLAVGGEAMVTTSDGLLRSRVGATAKWMIEPAGVLLQAELQYARQQVDGPGDPNQLIGYLMASRAFDQALLLDVGIGHYDENLAIQGLDRDGVDVNLHWFLTSHLELVWQNRVEGIGIGSRNGGATSGWSLLHAHYRL